MKKTLLVLAFLISALSINAQMHVFKTQPYTFTDATRASRTIVGIKAKMIGNIDCNLSDHPY